MAYFKKPGDYNVSTGTSYWLKYIKKRISDNKNFLGCFIGQTGTGKSYSAISLQELLEEGILKEENVFYKATDFMKRLYEGNLAPGTVLVWDEAGKDLNAKQWQAKANRVVSVVFQIFRRENIIVLFTLPYFSFLDPDARKLVHATFETQGIDKETKETIVKPLIIQVNQDTGKMYKKFLRVIDGDNGLIPVKKIRLPKANDEFLKKYELNKEKFSKDVYKEAYEELMAMEVKKKSGKELTEKQKEVLEDTEKGLNQYQIAEKRGISQAGVSNILRAARKKQEIRAFL